MIVFSSFCSLLTHSPPPFSPFILSQRFRDTWFSLQVVERSTQQLPGSSESTDETCHHEDFLVIPDLPHLQVFSQEFVIFPKKGFSQSCLQNRHWQPGFQELWWEGAGEGVAIH